MKPRYFGVAHQESDKILLTSSADDFSFQEFPSQKHEVLTFNNKKFSQPRYIEEEQNLDIKINAHQTRPSKPYGSNFTSSFITHPLAPMNKKKRDGQCNNSSPPLEREGFLRIEVVDSGCGIKEEDLRTVFHNLEQTDTRT